MPSVTATTWNSRVTTVARDYKVKLASDAFARATGITILVARAIATTSSCTIGVSVWISKSPCPPCQAHCILDVHNLLGNFTNLEDWVSQYDSIWVKDLM